MTGVSGSLWCVLIGNNNEVSSYLEKREMSATMCEEGVVMWMLHRAVILQGKYFILMIMLNNNCLISFLLLPEF